MVVVLKVSGFSAKIMGHVMDLEVAGRLGTTEKRLRLHDSSPRAPHRTAGLDHLQSDAPSDDDASGWSHCHS